MDDMAGVAVVAGLGKYLDEAKRAGDWLPERTEVVLLATSSEEAGLRGAKRYASKHLQELKTTPTYGLFLDNIYNEKYLTVINKEICTRATHDPELVKMARDAAEHHNWPIAVRSIPIEGGGTDAAALSVKGIPAICLLCQDISRAVPNYHTRNDTYEHIRPESLSVSLQLVIDMLKQIDKK
jgi:Zn-dependent M28 family amino/carboxypeptidase